jgi:hypothetical protein
VRCLAVLALLVGTVLGGVVPPGEAAGPGDGCRGWDCGKDGPVRPDRDGIGVGDDDRRPGSDDPGAGGPGGTPVAWRPGGPAYEYGYAPACPANAVDPVAGFTDSVRCPAADTCPDRAQTRLFLARRVAGPPPGRWQRLPGTWCLTAAQRLPYDPAAVHAFAADYFRHLPLPRPGIHVQPVAQSVVNLPTIFRADPPPAGVFMVTEPPFPTITIQARPTWRWDFGDGVRTTSGTPGRAYDGTDPRQYPGHYVAHSYRQPGRRTAVVTARWTATYRVAGLPGQRLMPGWVERTSGRVIPVFEYRAVLTDNR